MKKCINGIYVEMTSEEIAELEKLATETVNIPPTEAERLEALEQAFMELVEVVVNG